MDHRPTRLPSCQVKSCGLRNDCFFCGGSQHYGSGSQLVILGARRAPYFGAILKKIALSRTEFWTVYLCFYVCMYVSFYVWVRSHQ